MKYMDTDKLLAEIKDFRKIAAKRIKNDEDAYFIGMTQGYNNAIFIIESHQQEQPTKGYDENYLNEKIAKASKTWENVDVDKYMDEVRGREQEQPEVDLDFQVFAKEMDAVFNIPKEVTENTEENPLINWEYAIARHFFELGLKARKK